MMSVPVVNISEEMDELRETEDAVTSEAVSAKRKLHNGSSASGDVSKEIEVELMKAPSKRAARASAKATKSGKSAKLTSKLSTVAEKPSETGGKGRKPTKAKKKQASKTKVSHQRFISSIPYEFHKVQYSSQSIACAKKIVKGFRLILSPFYAPEDTLRSYSLWNKVEHCLFYAVLLRN